MYKNIAEYVKETLISESRNLPIGHFHVWTQREEDVLGIYCVFFGLDRLTLEKAEKEYQYYIAEMKSICKNYVDCILKFLEQEDFETISDRFEYRNGKWIDREKHEWLPDDLFKHLVMMIRIYWKDSNQSFEEFIGTDILKALKDKNTRVYRWQKYGAGTRINILTRDKLKVMEDAVNVFIDTITEKGKELLKELDLTTEQIGHIKESDKKNRKIKYFVLRVE